MTSNKLKPTKTKIGQILSPWSSSRANEYSKATAVEIALKILIGDYHIDKITFQTGSFSPRSRCTGGSWLVDGNRKVIEQLGEGDKVLSTWQFR
jgi:hypothetical protein